MTDREALLRAVCENLDDDLPRLVFADWLEEHDEPERAQFIRFQIPAAHRFERGESIDKDPDWVRANKLAKQHGATWSIGCSPPRHRITFRMWRGFPFWLVAPDRQSLQQLEQTSPEVPTWEFLSLGRLSPNGAKYLAMSRYTPKIRLLAVADLALWGTKLATFFNRVDWSGLRYLSLRGCALGYSPCVALSESTGLTRLRVLDLGNTQIGNAGVAAL